MSQLDDRMKEMQEFADRYGGPGTWTQRLLDISGGSVKSAAIADLAIEGNYWNVDLRRKPFQGNEELKELYRRASETNRALSKALIDLAWSEDTEKGNQ